MELLFSHTTASCASAGRELLSGPWLERLASLNTRGADMLADSWRSAVVNLSRAKREHHDELRRERRRAKDLEKALLKQDKGAARELRDVKAENKRLTDAVDRLQHELAEERARSTKAIRQLDFANRESAEADARDEPRSAPAAAPTEPAEGTDAPAPEPPDTAFEQARAMLAERDVLVYTGRAKSSRLAKIEARFREAARAT